MILVTGSQGQIGTDLVAALRKRHGTDRVIESDLQPVAAFQGESRLYETLDVTDPKRLREVLRRRGIEVVYHLASLLSAKGEELPNLCWEVNVTGLRNVLEVAKESPLKVFWPSSIAVFGPHTPKHGVPQVTIKDPSTMYGITKVAGELLCRYYALRYEVDVRSLRLPGIISYAAPPGGGTTDYAVAIFHEALSQGSYTCFVRPDTSLPMMYMPDAIRAIVKLMDAKPSAIKVRTSYNLSAVSFSAEELAEEIRKRIPHFECRYKPDFRQEIADSWPSEVDDSKARADWGWRHKYSLPALVDDMLDKLSQRMETR